MNVLQFLPKEPFGVGYPVIVVRLKYTISGITPPSGAIRYTKPLQEFHSAAGSQLLNNLFTHVALEVSKEIAHAQLLGETQKQMVVIRHYYIREDADTLFAAVEAKSIEEESGKIGANFEERDSVADVAGNEMNRMLR